MKQIMQAFIVSKDRACQLDATLRSLAKHTTLVDKVTILFKASNSDFKKGYHKCFERHFPFKTHGIEETNFHDDFIERLELISKEAEFVLGLTDDTVIYRQLYCDAQDIKNWWEDETLCHSLRLGRNTTIQDCSTGLKMRKIPGMVPADYKNTDNEYFISWNWKKLGGDDNLNYPVSIDGVVYESDELLQMSKSINFKNLREWEGELVAKTRKENKKCEMMCNELSSCVNISINMVQSPWNKDMPYYISEKELNDKFLNNEIIDLSETFKNQKIIGSHQYLPLKFSKI